MSLHFKPQIAALFSALAVLAGCQKAEFNYDLEIRQTDGTTYKSSVYAVNDEVTLYFKSLRPERPLETFTFQCSDKSAIENEYNLAVAESQKLQKEVEVRLQAATAEILNKSEAAVALMQEIMERQEYAGGRIAAFRNALDICSPS